MKKLENCVGLTTGVMIIYVVLANLPVAFMVVFMFFLISQGLLLWMVYRILKDRRTSAKTFDQHFYEDFDPDRS